MSMLRSIEQKIEGLVEGVFSRAFRSELQPVEIARRLSREMDRHKTASVSKLYVPNEYVVWLAPQDHERFSAFAGAMTQDLSSHLLDHARRSNFDLLTRPTVELRADDRLREGEFGIQARLVKAPAGGAAAQGEAGETRIFRAQPAEPRETAPVAREGSAVLALPDKRYVLDEDQATIGRSRDCDCMVKDPNVSRRHARLRRTPRGWQVSDLGSTNGVKVNGRRVEEAYLQPGDEIVLGTTRMTFDTE